MRSLACSFGIHRWVLVHSRSPWSKNCWCYFACSRCAKRKAER